MKVDQKAARARARRLTFHAVNLRTKTEVMLEHFRTGVKQVELWHAKRGR